MIRTVLAFIVLASLVLSHPASSEEDVFECMIEPRERVVVSTPVAGILIEVTVERGDRVLEGQVLARLETEVEEAAVAVARARAQAEAELHAAETRFALETRRLERTQELFGKGVVSDLELDEAQSSMAMAEAEWLAAKEGKQLMELELARAEAALRRRTIRSPMSGIVGKRFHAPGEYADPPELFEISQLDPLFVEVFVPSTHIGRVQIGQQAIVRPEEPVGGRHEARIVVVDSMVDAASGMLGIRLEMPNPQNSILAGLRCDVDFVPPIALEEKPAPRHAQQPAPYSPYRE